MQKTKLYLNYAGYCMAQESHAIKGGNKRKIKFHALFALVKHPTKGYILFDTGYTSRFHEACKSFPNKIYALITKVFIRPEEEVKAQLQAAGIAASDIKHIIVSHFHADHIGGLKDFKNATFYTSKVALNSALKIPSSRSFTKGILKSLFPKNIKDRCVFIEDNCPLVADNIFNNKYDIFDDSSIYAVPLPGHAAGQMGIYLETQKRSYFLIADACWLKKSYEENILPNPIVKLFFDSWSDFKDSLNKISQLHIENPSVCIVPTHCYESTSPLVKDKIDFNVL